MKSFLIAIFVLICTVAIYSQSEILPSQTYNGSVTTGELCYYTGTEWDEANATSEATSSKILGIAIGNNQILLHGYWKTTGLVAGNIYYVSTTEGQITNTAPSTSTNIVRVIGYAMSTTKLYLFIDNTWVEIQ